MSEPFTEAEMTVLHQPERCVICDMASSTKGRVDPLTAVCTKYPRVARGCTSTFPSSGKKFPAMIDKRVDFPAPLGPTIPTLSPLLIFQSMSVMRRLAPAATETSFT